MLENKNGILIFFIVCTLDKKICHGFLVRDKNSCFCPVSCYLSCPIPWPVSKSNRVRKKVVLSSPLFFRKSNAPLIINFMMR